MKAYRKEIFKSRFQEHYPRLCCIACGYVSDKEDAEDIVQELFISVWNKGLEKNLVTTRIDPANGEDIVRELAFLCGCKYETLEEDSHYRLYNE